MSTVIVFTGVTLPPLPAGVTVVHCADAAEMVRAIHTHPAAVLLRDGLAEDDALLVAAAIHESGATVIEVNAHSWDGESHSRLTATCKGVIAGFGLAAIPRALEALDALTA
ncbi:MAG: hypothetical protein AB7T37_09335 [Dehalococcoidia bacterium]